MVFEDLNPASDIWEIDDDLTVESAWSGQSLVQRFWIVRCRNQDHTSAGAEAIEFRQQLVEGLLGVRWVAGVPLAANSIKLVDEYDARSFISGLRKQISHTLSADSNIKLVKFGPRHVKDGTTSFACNSARKKCLSGTGRSNQKNAFGNLSAESGKPLRVK